MATDWWKTTKKIASAPYKAMVNPFYAPTAIKNVRSRLAAGLGAQSFIPQTAYANEGAMEFPVGQYDTGKEYGPEQPQTQETDYTNDTTGGGEPTPAFLRYLGGQMYDDPIAYANAVMEASMTEYNRQKKMLDNAYQSGLLEFSQYEDQLKQSRDNVKSQYGEAMGGISGRFSAQGADVYQSAQGTAENRAGDITNQNYANIAGQEANLGQQKTLYNEDYANNLESNRLAQQEQVDATMNSTADALAGTSYANQLGSVKAPDLNLAKMDSSILGVYDNLSQLSASGNTAAVKSTIDNSNLEPNLKNWLYTRFGNPTTV